MHNVHVHICTCTIKSQEVRNSLDLVTLCQSKSIDDQSVITMVEYHVVNKWPDILMQGCHIDNIWKHNNKCVNTCQHLLIVLIFHATWKASDVKQFIELDIIIL